MKKRKPSPISEPQDPGLTDRSERPTSHKGFAPMEKRKQREEDAFHARARRRH